MPCNCGKRTSLDKLMSKTSSYPSNGGYPLGSYPECTELYPAYGPSAGTGIYVAGRGSDHETLFGRTELVAASQFCRANKVKLESVPTTALCNEAVIAVYGR